MTIDEMITVVKKGLAQELKGGKWAISPSSSRPGEIWVIRPTNGNTKIESFTIVVKKDDNEDTNNWMHDKIGERDGN